MGDRFPKFKITIETINGEEYVHGEKEVCREIENYCSGVRKLGAAKVGTETHHFSFQNGQFDHYSKKFGRRTKHSTIVPTSYTVERHGHVGSNVRLIVTLDALDKTLRVSYPRASSSCFKRFINCLKVAGAKLHVTGSKAERKTERKNVAKWLATLRRRRRRRRILTQAM